MIKLILITIFVHFSYGESVEFLINSQTMEELMHKDAKEGKRIEMRHHCQREIQDNHFPSHCFMELENSVHYGMSQKHWRSEKQRLNILCLRNSKKMNSLTELVGALKSPLLTKDCKESLEQRRLDLIYIDGKSSSIHFKWGAFPIYLSKQSEEPSYYARSFGFTSG